MIEKTVPSNPFETIWTIVDDHWRCVSDKDESRCLCEYLLDFGFSVPDSIKYCIAENSKYWLKFREFGANIHCYIHKIS